MAPIKVLSVFGTRPEAIKMIPLVKTLAMTPGITSQCCVSGQHREMLDDVLGAFDIKPEYDLDIMENAQTLYSVTSKTLLGMKTVLERCRPDLVLVHGDTSTSFSAALAAFYAKIPVGHVEAGLRTYERYSPYPEEINRQLTGRIAALHFCPTAKNEQNLLRENISEGIFVTGNTVIDMLGMTVRPDYTFKSSVLRDMEWQKRRVLLLTAHRRENYGEPLQNIFSACLELIRLYDDIEIIYPTHPSPPVRETALKMLGGVERVRLIEPLGVHDMHNAMARAALVLTDSGGLQEEAPSLGKPVLVLRRETERPEAVGAGTVKMAGVETDEIVRQAAELLSDSLAYAKMARAVNPYGDGKASQRITDAILCYFGKREGLPEGFLP